MRFILKLFAWLLFFPFMLTYWGYKTHRKSVVIVGGLLSAFFVFAMILGESAPPIEEDIAAIEAPIESGQTVDEKDMAEDVIVGGAKQEPLFEEITKPIEVAESSSNAVDEDSSEEVSIVSAEEDEFRSVDDEPIEGASAETPTFEPVEEVIAAEPSVSFEGYRLIEVAGGALSGYREANVVVDIGFGPREYWAFTNEYGQLIRVVADEIIPQNEAAEDVLSSGRYYPDEAKVPGTEAFGLDEAHVIADSLGGVANAYNITPQDSTLNRYGDQAYMEKGILDAGGCTNFEAIITYPNTETQVPSHYQYTYTLMGNVIVDSFDNVDPDVVNASLGDSTETTIEKSSVVPAPATETPANETSAIVVPPSKEHNLASVDTNGNGKVTISEAKAAGFKMPIRSDHWLYPYMDDRDGDGMVGE